MVIIRCVCAHEYQDRRYGDGKRVHTVGQKDRSGDPPYYCTVCGKKNILFKPKAKDKPKDEPTSD